MTRLTVAAVLSLTLLGLPAFAGQAAPAQPAAGAQTLAAQATPKMAFINLQRIAEGSAEGKIAAAKVQALNQKKVNELTEKNKLLQANQQKLQQGGAVLNDAARSQLEKDIDKLNIELQRFQQDANAEVQELQVELQNQFQQKLMPVVEALVKDMGISILFSVADAGVVYIEPTLDITDSVLRRFDAAMASPATKPPASSAPAPKPPAPPSSAAPAQPPPAAPAPKPRQK